MESPSGKNLYDTALNASTKPPDSLKQPEEYFWGCTSTY
jgi:hypothetical protein